MVIGESARVEGWNSSSEHAGFELRIVTTIGSAFQGFRVIVSRGGPFTSERWSASSIGVGRRREHGLLQDRVVSGIRSRAMVLRPGSS